MLPNVKVKHKTLFTFCLFKQRKMNIQNKTVIKIHDLLEGETANYVYSMQPMLVSYSSCYLSYLDGDIRKKVSKFYLTLD